MSSLERLFPNLVSEGHQLTSPSSPRYNCIAWAAGRDDVWMWPDALDQCAWPEGVPRTESLDSFIAAFAELGFRPCDSYEFEVGLEKVALYAFRGRPVHAARQLPDGHWTSKCGRLEDIAHTLAGLEGSDYGTVAAVLSRPMGPSANGGPGFGSPLQ